MDPVLQGGEGAEFIGDLGSGRKWCYFIAKRGIKYTVEWLFSVPV